ncbi:hypothetical protein O1L60_02795 [Streptomyces diastatochromogenes]|nr:hypothetical protein [Streptomyces diastatochromogenes]
MARAGRPGGHGHGRPGKCATSLFGKLGIADDGSANRRVLAVLACPNKD